MYVTFFPNNVTVWVNIKINSICKNTEVSNIHNKELIVLGIKSWLTSALQVSAVPSVLAVKDGKVVDKFVGLQEESRIEAFVNRLIGE